MNRLNRLAPVALWIALCAAPFAAAPAHAQQGAAFVDRTWYAAISALQCGRITLDESVGFNFSFQDELPRLAKLPAYRGSDQRAAQAAERATRDLATNKPAVCAALTEQDVALVRDLESGRRSFSSPASNAR